MDRAFYIANQGKTVRVGRYTCTVSKTTTESRGGSWERGFKFSRSTWAMLTHKTLGFSMDGGKTWHASIKAARKSKGKIKLDGHTHGELAFEGIQAINRAYYGSGYKWRR